MLTIQKHRTGITEILKLNRDMTKTKLPLSLRLTVNGPMSEQEQEQVEREIRALARRSRGL